MAGPPQPTVTTHDDFGTVNVVETPTSPSAAFTLSRFEFQAGTKGNEGTKILMVEWDVAAALDARKKDGEDDKKEGESKRNEPEVAAAAAADPNDWEVKWDGKEVLTTVKPIRDADTPAQTCRLYFLLPPGAPIPALVTVSHRRRSDHATAVPDLHAKPLPAIFPEGLTGQDKGARGVLHTIWARARLEQLGAEISAEMKSNGESVGLEMALQERQWIVDHFGLGSTAGDLDGGDGARGAALPLEPQGAGSPTSPRSPLGGRLGEKLKGLKLATSPAELAAAKEGEFLLCRVLFQWRMMMRLYVRLAD